jgi:hypothetical protein
MPLKNVRIVAQPDPATSETAPIPLSCTMTDIRGNVIDCDLTMLFVPHGATSLGNIPETYKATHSTVPTSPQRIVLADDQTAPGATTFTVTGFKFDVKTFAIHGALQPPFLPFIETAQIIAPDVEKLLGSAAGALSGARAPTREMKFHDKYKKHEFTDLNPAQVFAEFSQAMPAIMVPPERAGGLAAPQFKPMNGLSRVRGLVSDVASAAENQINLDEMLDDGSKLLGVITLKKMIEAVSDNVPSNNLGQLFKDIDLPHVTATRPILSTVQTADGVEVRFLWKPALKTREADLPKPLVNNGGMGLTVKGGVRTSRNPNAGANFEIDGKLVNFGLKFGNLLTVNFDEVAFKSGGAKKMEVRTKLAGLALDDALAPITLGDQLKFIQKMQGLLSTGGLGNAPTIQPQPDGVVVRFGVAIPSFAIGILSIQNIALTTSVSLPFVEKPAAVRLSLSERANPFLVSVSIFGGTGFFALEMRTDGTVLIEAGIEFGGIVSINLLGIVSGGVYVFAGIYFSVGSANNIAVSGHLRFGGNVDVAGIISVSIEFYIALTYQIADKVLIGEGRVTIGVKVLFFSLKKTFSVSRRISGFGDAPGEGLVFAVAGDQSTLPNFTTTMSPAQWHKYCKTFA